MMGTVGDFIIRAADDRDAVGLAHAWKEFGRFYAEIDATEFRVPDDEGLPEWFESRLRTDAGEDASWLVADHDGRSPGSCKPRSGGPPRTQIDNSCEKSQSLF